MTCSLSKSLLTTTVFSASVAVGSRRLPLEEHPDPGGEREPVRAPRHQQEGVQEDPGGGKFNNDVNYRGGEVIYWVKDSVHVFF